MTTIHAGKPLIRFEVPASARDRGRTGQDHRGDRFRKREEAREWYDSPAYEAIKPIRQSSAKSRILIAEGIAPQ